MTFSKTLVVTAFAGIFGLGFTGTVHHYSKDATERFIKERVPEPVVKKNAFAKKPPPVAVPAGDPEKGKLAFNTCVPCHGKDAAGGRLFNAPRLAGQRLWYLRKQLLKFKDGVRGAHAQDMGGMQMAANARTLFDDEAVNNVVAYIGTLNPAKPADRGRGDAEQGRSLYSLCSSCHGQSAEGITLQKAPRLNSQHAWYLTKQLGNFKAGVRGSHQDDVEGKIMNAITQALADEEAINNIVAYIQSLE